MNTRSKTIAISLAITLFAMQGAEAAAKKSVTIKKAGRATSQTLNTILSGSGVPTKSIGIDGDLYIDIKNANLYGPKTKGAWKAATSLRVSESKNKVAPMTGLAGATGAVGAVGAKGATGDRGLNGATGATGATGTPGAKGDTGLTGTAGLVGSSGTNGAQGLSGAVGAKGDAGLNGTPGVTGANGVAGLAGTPGVSGIAGANGTPGANGGAGVKGDTGLTGAAGAAGVSNSYFQSITNFTLNAGIDGSSIESAEFITLESNSNYTIQIIMNGIFSPTSPDPVNINMELLNSLNLSSLTYTTISSDSGSFANGYAGRHYAFLVIGKIVTGGASSTLKVRAIVQYAMSPARSVLFSGYALINKVGAIG
ncbi:MAG: collagen-like protein [Candidatus Planktophila sp.]|nr:collagen-like protein [Candidatus Planktophila sp.]